VRRIHLSTGLLAVIAFLITGQVMGHHIPKMQFLTPDVHQMYVSRHIYLLGAALVNLVLGLYVQLYAPGWRRILQLIGSLFIVFAAISLLLAFVAEPAFGLAGRSWRSYFGLIALFPGVLIHTVASLGRLRNPN
jgi:hypothetical protein